MTQIVPDDLTSAARAARVAQLSARLAGAMLRCGDLLQAEQALAEAELKAGHAVGRLHNAGVPVQAISGLQPPAPLTLEQLDTPETRTLLKCVQALIPLADHIDRARGRSLPDAPATDTLGTDLAETLHQLACRLQLEVFGPDRDESLLSSGKE